ncbi:MAG: VOC family protein [Nocardioides sp.]|nr:VOC family protein [Nocardioides sp.]
MASRLNPYLSFDGNAREAMKFYADVLGGTLSVDTWGDYLGSHSTDAARVGHAVLESPAGYTLMAGDVTSDTDYQPISGMAVSISGDDPALLMGYWARLSTDGSIVMPLERRPWGDDFGMCVDRFGVSWMINISRPEPA